MPSSGSRSACCLIPLPFAADETKNNSGRTIPVSPQLRALLLAQRVKRYRQRPNVCFRLDRRGHAARIGGFRKAWPSACIKAGLGKMEPAIDPVTGETGFAKLRVDRPHSKPKVKMVSADSSFTICAGVAPVLFCSLEFRRKWREITGHKTRRMLAR